MPDFCVFCSHGDDDNGFKNGDAVRPHHRGGFIHEACFVERERSSTFQPEFYGPPMTYTYMAAYAMEQEEAYWDRREATPARYYVRCADGAIRHAEPFTSHEEADNWAEWGHGCLSAESHRIDRR